MPISAALVVLAMLAMLALLALLAWRAWKQDNPKARLLEMWTTYAESDNFSSSACGSFKNYLKVHSQDDDLEKFLNSWQEIARQLKK
jgi:hypothetical protein